MVAEASRKSVRLVIYGSVGYMIARKPAAAGDINANILL